MQPKIDYENAYNELRRSAENELKDVLVKLPNHVYEFVPEDVIENLDEIDVFRKELNIPILRMNNHFCNELFNLFVTSISLKNNVLIIEGFEKPEDIEIKTYSPIEVADLKLSSLFQYIH